MAFDAFYQFLDPDTNAPPAEGEDQAPPMASPSPALELQEEKPTEATEKVSDSTATRKP
jgi:hypothetical protein